MALRPWVVTMDVPYAWIEAGWFLSAVSLIGAGIGIIWKLARS